MVTGVYSGGAVYGATPVSRHIKGGDSHSGRWHFIILSTSAIGIIEWYVCGGVEGVHKHKLQHIVQFLRTLTPNA